MLETLHQRVNWPFMVLGSIKWLLGDDRLSKWSKKFSSLMYLVSPKHQNLSPVAHHISQGQASKDGRFEDASNME